MMFLFELSNYSALCFPCLVTSWKAKVTKRQAALNKKERKVETLQGIKISNTVKINSKMA